MKIFLFFAMLFALTSIVLAQEEPQNPEATPDTTTVEQPVPAEQPVDTSKPVDTTANAEQPKKQVPHVEAVDFWYNMDIKQVLLAIALFAQILERILEFLFVAFAVQSYRKKVFISAFFGFIIAGGMSYLTELHLLLLRIPTVQDWNMWGQIATMSLIIYCCTQPLHRVLKNKSSLDAKPELPKLPTPEAPKI